MTAQELSLRIALAALCTLFDRICSVDCRIATKYPEYNQARELLSARKETNAE